jgi:hypothetical protein
VKKSLRFWVLKILKNIINSLLINNPFSKTESLLSMNKKIFVSFFISVAMIVGSFAFSAPKVAAAQSNLWEVAQMQVGQGASNASVYSAVKDLATKYSIRIPEWNWNLAGKLDVHKLSKAFLKLILDGKAASAQEAEFTFSCQLTNVNYAIYNYATKEVLHDFSPCDNTSV